MKSEYIAEKGIEISNLTDNSRIIEADLFGEGEWIKIDTQEIQLNFERGVTTFPLPQQKIYLTPKNELKFLYGHQEAASIIIGEHVGSGGAKCYININELLGKHTAILGSTGSGKSGAVSVLLHEILKKGTLHSYQAWHPRIVILDPHNEYQKAFSTSKKYSLDDDSLILPYWLLSFQEIVNLVFGKTAGIATTQVAILKKFMIEGRVDGAKKIGIDETKITVDSPVPFDMNELFENIQSERDT